MEVTILSRKLVKPSKPTPQEKRNFPISSFDQLIPPMYVGNTLYYYLANEVADISQIKQNLEESLAKVLDLYYPIAGRYHSERLAVDCNDEGVEFIEAQVNCELSRVLGGGRGRGRGEDDHRQFNLQGIDELLPPDQVESATSPLALFQLNYFECGGIAIGAIFSHRIFDGYTVNQFLHGWANAAREGNIENVQRPSFTLASMFPARERPPEELARLFPFTLGTKTKLVYERFVINEEAITKLKAIAKDGTKNVTSFSRVEVALGLIWKAIIQAGRSNSKSNNGELGGAFALSLAVNMRGRIKLPAPETACGNMAIPNHVFFVPEADSPGVEFPKLAVLLHRAFRSTFAAKHGEDVVARGTWTNNQNTEWVIDSASASNRDGGGSGSGNSNKVVQVCMVMSLVGFQWKDGDFGFGVPTWMSLYMPWPAVALLPAKEGDGVEALLAWDQETMPLILQDTDLLAFAS